MAAHGSSIALHSLQDRCHRLCRKLVEHRDARAGERHQLIGYQVDEHVRRTRKIERKWKCSEAPFMGL